MSNRIITLRPDKSPKVIGQFFGFKLEAPFEATRQENIKLFEENLEGFERVEKMRAQIQHQIRIDSGRIPPGTPFDPDTPISYQPQRAQATYSWLPWAALILAMVGLYLFATLNR